MNSLLLTFTLLVSMCILETQFTASQSVTTCSQCRYGECEQLIYSYSCHCVMGVKGTYCDRLLQNGEDLCLSNPCWNGGICRNLGNDWSCDCPAGSTGKNCRTVTAVTVTYSPITFPAVTTTTAPRAVQDKYVRVFNKGGYTALMTLTYYNPDRVVQEGSILSGQSYAFYVPGAVDYDSTNGAVLYVKAAGGNQVMNKRIVSNPECFDIWGTTLFTAYSSVNC